MGHCTVSLCELGWTATPEKVDVVKTKLSEIGIKPNCVIIIDLLGNSVFRCQEFDGTLSLLKKTHNGYHVPGR